MSTKLVLKSQNIEFRVTNNTSGNADFFSFRQAKENTVSHPKNS